MNPRRWLSSIRVWLAANLIGFLALLAVHFSGYWRPRPEWWTDAFAVATNILAGGLVSFFFYLLVVHLPEQRKRRILKANLAQMYRNLKSDILYQVVFASMKGGRHDLQTDTESMERLMSVEGFRDAFKDGREADEGFYAFENQMSDDTPEFRQIVLLLELLARQIGFVLHNYTIDDDKLFGLFKHLEIMLISLRYSTPGYEESKPLCRFIYEIFAGWHPMEGYRDHDLIERAISEI